MAPNAPGLSGEGHVMLIRVHEGPPLLQLLVPQERAGLRPPARLSSTCLVAITHQLIHPSLFLPK